MRSGYRMGTDARNGRWIRSLALALLAATGLMLAGCAMPSAQFTYHPNASIAQSRRIPLSVVVLPFEDGTPDRKVSSAFFECYNLTKEPPSDAKVAFIPPERWSWSLAQDLAASGAFAPVSYAEGSRDPIGGVLVRGKVLNALFKVGPIGRSCRMVTIFRPIFRHSVDATEACFGSAPSRGSTRTLPTPIRLRLPSRSAYSAMLGTSWLRRWKPGAPSGVPSRPHPPRPLLAAASRSRRSSSGSIASKSSHPGQEGSHGKKT